MLLCGYLIAHGLGIWCDFPIYHEGQRSVGMLGIDFISKNIAILDLIHNGHQQCAEDPLTSNWLHLVRARYPFLWWKKNSAACDRTWWDQYSKAFYRQLNDHIKSPRQKKSKQMSKIKISLFPILEIILFIKDHKLWRKYIFGTTAIVRNCRTFFFSYPSLENVMKVNQ